MKPDQPIEIKDETFFALKNLVQSVQVSLNGLDSRIKREIEVIAVSRALVSRINDILAEIQTRSSDGP